MQDLKFFSRSITKYEYHVKALAFFELIWLKSLLVDMHISLYHAFMLYTDSTNANDLSHNPVFHARTKHIEVDHHFLRYQVVIGSLVVQHVNSSDHIANCLTKPLVNFSFLFLRPKLRSTYIGTILYRLIVLPIQIGIWDLDEG